jgi:hypothetical protein
VDAADAGTALGVARLVERDAQRLQPRAHQAAHLHTTTNTTTLPKVETNCTAPSLKPTVNGNTVRCFSTHGHQSAAKGSSTTVSRSDIRLVQQLDFSAYVV